MLHDLIDTLPAERALQLRLRGQLADARPHPGQRRRCGASRSSSTSSTSTPSSPTRPATTIRRCCGSGAQAPPEPTTFASLRALTTSYSSNPAVGAGAQRSAEQRRECPPSAHPDPEPCALPARRHAALRALQVPGVHRRGGRRADPPVTTPLTGPNAPVRPSRAGRRSYGLPYGAWSEPQWVATLENSAGTRTERARPTTPANASGGAPAFIPPSISVRSSTFIAGA